jgi:hypothetical protein
MRSALSLFVACGASSTQAPAVTPTEDDAAVVFVGEHLTDDTSAAIERAIAAELGFPVRALVRVSRGRSQLVLYSMNALTHWLAKRPDRDALIRAAEQCSAEGAEEPARCLDFALRDARRPELFAGYLETCRRNIGRDDLPEAEIEQHCADEFESNFVFDAPAYCDGGFWALAQETERGWSIIDAPSLDGPCVTQVLGAHTADVDGDRVPEVLLDAVYPHTDYMRGMTESYTRELSVWRSEVSSVRSTFAVELGVYAGDPGGFPELRCGYAIEGDARPTLRRECCWEPMGLERPVDSFPTEPSADCGPRWIESYPASTSGGFTICRTVVREGEARALRVTASDDAEELDQVRAGDPLAVTSRRDGWVETVVDRGERPSGWLREDQTELRCRER